MKRENERYGALIERGKVLSGSDGRYVIASITRDGIKTKALSGGTHAVGEIVYYFMFGDGTGRIIGGGPGSSVESVNGKTGAVTLDYSDVGAAAANHDHDADYLKLSGGTMSGAISLASTGLSTYNEAGYSTDQYGNFVHKRADANDYWNLKNNAGSGTFGVRYESGEVNLGTWKASPVEIAYGGTGATTRANAANALVNLGTTPITSTANDMVGNWRDLRAGIAWYNVSGQLNGQPTQYGLLVNLNTSASQQDVHQIWAAQSNGSLFHRGGNSSGWGSTSWKTILDSSNYTSFVTPGNIGAATASHTHSYLPLTGGNLTGTISLLTSGDTYATPFNVYDTSTNTYRSAMNVNESNELAFRVYKTGNSSVYEWYALPIATATSNKGYNILTSKNAVTVPQGGTGATTPAAARQNLGVPSVQHFQIGGGETATLTITGNIGIVIAKRDNDYAVAIVDYWGLPIIISSGGTSPTISSSGGSNTVTVKNNRSSGAMAGMMICFG